MKKTSSQIKTILENENFFNSLKNTSNANPNLEVQELSLKEAFDSYVELKDMLLEGIDKGVLDEISFNSRNAVLSHLQNAQKFINDPNRLIPQLSALQYQVQITDLRNLTFEGLKVEIELKEITALRRRYTKLLKDIASAEKVKSELTQIDTSIKNIVKSIELAKNESDQYKKLLLTIKSEIEASKTSIIKSEQDVENKKQEVLEFANNVDVSKENLSKYENDIKTKIEKANGLIRQAEIALELKSTEGISAAYSSRLNKLSEENSKRNWLYGAIGFVTLTFLTGYLLTGGQINLWQINIGFQATENIAFIVGRILLTGIGITGAVFCANRYVQIRNLEEDYEYKVVLSKSILAFANKIKELDDKKTADYLNKVLNDLHQDPLRDRTNRKETDMEAISKLTEMLINWKNLTE